MSKSIFIFTILVVFVAIAIWFVAQKTKEVSETTATPTATPRPSPETGESIQYDNGLVVQDIVVGTGAEVKAGDTISVNYVGALADGTVFDASANHGGPATFQIGVGQLIKGWDQGIPGMKVGGKRKLIIPPELGYGAQGAGNAIPPNATLLFEIELVSINKK